MVSTRAAFASGVPLTISVTSIAPKQWMSMTVIRATTKDLAGLPGRATAPIRDRQVMAESSLTFARDSSRNGLAPHRGS